MEQKKINEMQRKRRKLNNNADVKKYEKTKSGFLVRCYRNMKSRILGIQSKKSHLYSGKSLLTKEEFYLWSKSNQSFHDLFVAWETSGYERRLTPSVDRIDSRFGYDIANIEWVPFYINCSRGGKSKKCRRGSKDAKIGTAQKLGGAFEDIPNPQRSTLSIPVQELY